MNCTKQEILNFLSIKTKQFIQMKYSECDTSAISNFLCLSRSLTSQYLNELVKEELLIKIQERPVIFLNKEIIEKEYKFQFQTIYFEDTEQFFSFLNLNIKKVSNFSKAISYDTSLKYCILQCETAINYPPNGLPIILSGEAGTGKRFLSKLTYEYAIDEKILTKNDPFIIFECKPHDEHEKLLFGYIENNNMINGLFQKIQNGILVIHHAEYLSDITKEKLAQYIKTNTYIPVGDIKAQDSKIRLIFSILQKPSEWANDILFRHIPIIINIPSLNERIPEDRKKYIYTFIKKETEGVNKSIFLSKALFNTLMNYSFKRNIEQLLKTIKICCANAFQTAYKNNSNLVLLQYHLPDDILARQEYEPQFIEDNKLINIESLNVESEINQVLFHYNKMIDNYLNSDNKSTHEFYQYCTNLMNTYFDYLIFEKKYANNRIKSIELVLNKVLDEISNQYNLIMPINCSFIIARILYSLIYSSNQYKQWEQQSTYINQFLNNISNDFERESGIIKDLDYMINQALDIHLDKMNKIFLTLYIHFYNKNPKEKKMMAIILSHGYSTASSIADASNRLIGKHIFEAIDMPVDTSVTEIIKILQRYLSNNYLGNEVILMVDMGSLENVGSLLDDIPNINIGIINNISTRIALEIGYMICDNKPMSEILKTVCETTFLQYKIVSNRKKENAIVFTTETGMTSTDRVIQLFRNSLPKENAINILPYNYYELIKHHESDELFKKYNVLFITGTLKINISNVPFVSLEDIINFNNINKINELMKKVYSDQEITEFNMNLMRNFSLENVMNYITILNPNHLLDFVEKTVKNLEMELNISFSTKARVGLYIHISCLIERLVTKTAISTYENLDNFISDNKDFIELVRDSFSEIVTHYNVEIPLTEIAYLCAYINNDTIK